MLVVVIPGFPDSRVPRRSSFGIFLGLHVDLGWDFPPALSVASKMPASTLLPHEVTTAIYSTFVQGFPVRGFRGFVQDKFPLMDLGLGRSGRILYLRSPESLSSTEDELLKVLELVMRVVV